MTPRISVLDQSPVVEGGTPARALRSTVRLAAAVEEFGYTRYWLAEHHDSPGFASTAPEVLAGVVLAHTRRMRVGSGGVLLPRYDPAKVVEAFDVLAALYPGRVDLGVGRTGGPADDFPAKVATLLASTGEADSAPKVWLLGSGTSSAALAAELGTAYCHAHFLNPATVDDALGLLRHQADVAVAVRAFVADTETEADQLVRGFLLWRSRKDLGQDLPLPAPDTVRRHHWSAAELARAHARLPSVVSGTPDQVGAALRAMADRHGVAEIMVNTLVHDEEARLRSYRLLAEAVTRTDGRRNAATSANTVLHSCD